MWVQKFDILPHWIFHYVQFIYFQGVFFNSYVIWKLILFRYKIHYS